MAKRRQINRQNLKQIIDLQPVDELRPAHLNSFRNTPHYQNALAHGVKGVQITLQDIAIANREKMELVFDGKHTYEEAGKKYTPTEPVFYRSPTIKVVTFMDKVQLARAVNPEAFGEAIYNPEAAIAYFAALERLARHDTSIARVKDKERRQEHEWCVETLEAFLKSPEGLNAMTLWNMHRGEGNPRIKNLCQAREATQNAIEFYAKSLGTAYSQLLGKLFE